MKTEDKMFLSWVYDRLVNVHHENPKIDYMKKLENLCLVNNNTTCGPQIGELWCSRSSYEVVTIVSKKIDGTSHDENIVTFNEKGVCRTQLLEDFTANYELIF